MRSATARRILATTYAVLPIALLVASVDARAQAWPSVATELPRAGGGEDDVAVVIGISDYFALPDVPGAADNARDWMQYLTRVHGIAPARATLLLDADATRGRIERALQAAAAQTKPTGRAIVVFVGHGAPAPTGDDGLLLGVDTQSDADSLTERGVAQEAVSAILAKGKQKETVLVYDACFSGMTADGEAPLVPGNQATTPNRRAPAPTKGSTVVLSASDSFAGPLPGQQRPAFSYVLLGALRGWADADRSKDVTLAEAYAFTDETMRAALKQSKRAPQMRGTASTIAFAKVREDRPDVGAILLGRCPDGTKWGGRQCVSAGCPAGTTWNGAACAATVAVVQCPSGTTWDGAACVGAAVQCPSGTTWTDGACRGAVVLAAPQAPRESNTSSSGPKRASAPAAGPDGDGDSVPDRDDLCPAHAETVNLHEDHDGCPDAAPAAGKKVLKVVTSEIAILGGPLAEHLASSPSGISFVKPLAFKTGGAFLKTESEPALRALATVVIGANKDARIECHSDSQGNDEFNLSLTQGRAEAIVRWLVEHGASANLLVAVGHGETKPIASNDTAQGRAQNRRCQLLWAD